MFAWLMGSTHERHRYNDNPDYKAGLEWGEQNATSSDDCAPHPLEFERGCLAWLYALEDDRYPDER